MAYTDGKTIRSRLRKGELSNLYYIYGEDVSSVEKLTVQIIKAAVGENEEFALSRINGRKPDMSELRDLTEMMPMMSDYNCILINDYNCEEQREDVTKQLIEILKNVPDMTIVIMNVTGFEVKTRFDYKTKQRVIADKNKKIADAVAKKGEVIGFQLKTPEELAKDIAASASALGGSISLNNAREIAERCLCDPLAAENEIHKLCSYAQGREITSEMVDSMVHRQSGVTVYKLADAVAAFDGKKAFEALDELMQVRENRGAVLAGITNSFLDMYRVRTAMQSGHRANEVVQDFGYYSRSFIIEKMFRSPARISLPRLRSCLTILRDTNMTLNSTGGDEKVILEQAVAKMLSLKN